jgi:hypothetical protein
MSWLGGRLAAVGDAAPVKARRERIHHPLWSEDV